MSDFKPFYIRICLQCKDPQPLKCAKCIHHPKRKPKVIEVYAPPMTLKICECRLSFQFECQRDGCEKRVWRSKTSNSRAGMVYAKKLFCSVECRMAQLHKDITTRVEVACDWCGKKVMRTPCNLKQENIFCCQAHIYLWRAKKRHDAKEAERREAMEAKKKALSLDIGLMHCAKCNDVTEHQTPAMRGRGKGHYKAPLAKCLKCGTERDQSYKAAALNSEAQMISMVGRTRAAAGSKK